MTTNLNMETFNWIHSGAGTRPLLDGLAVFFAVGGPSILAILFVALWFIAGNQRKITLLEATWAAVLGLVVNQIIGLFYFHPRPYMIGLQTMTLASWLLALAIMRVHGGDITVKSTCSGSSFTVSLPRTSAT